MPTLRAVRKYKYMSWSDVDDWRFFDCAEAWGVGFPLSQKKTHGRRQNSRGSVRRAGFLENRTKWCSLKEKSQKETSPFFWSVLLRGLPVFEKHHVSHPGSCSSDWHTAPVRHDLWGAEEEGGP